MKLPKELRIKIAGYALHDAEGLQWHWVTHFDENGTERRTGHFKSDCFRQTDLHSQLNPLGQVCRQLREDTMGVEFQVNTLYFTDFKELYLYAEYGLELFLDASNEVELNNVQSISLVCYRLNGARFRNICAWTDDIQETATIEVVDGYWWLDPLGEKLSSEHMQSFWRKGAFLEFQLSSDIPLYTSRKWRVVPACPYDWEEHFHEDAVSTHGFLFDTFRKWVTEGI